MDEESSLSVQHLLRKKVETEIKQKGCSRFTLFISFVTVINVLACTASITSGVYCNQAMKFASDVHRDLTQIRAEPDAGKNAKLSVAEQLATHLKSIDNAFGEGIKDEEYDIYDGGMDYEDSDSGEQDAENNDTFLDNEDNGHGRANGTVDDVSDDDDAEALSEETGSGEDPHYLNKRSENGEKETLSTDADSEQAKQQYSLGYKVRTI